MTKVLLHSIASAALFGAICVAACTPAPAKKDGGALNVTVGRDGAADRADGTASGAAGGAGTAPDGTGTAGTAGTTADPTGAAGATVTPDASAAGTTGAGGTGAAGTGVAGTGAAGTGSAGTNATTPDAGAAGTGATTDAGSADVKPSGVDPCNRASWTFTASVVCPTCGAPATRDPANAIDGNQATRYTSGIFQGSKGPETATLSFPASATVSGIRIVSAGGDGPSVYRVDWSTDRTTFWTFEPPASGLGSDDITVTFPSPKAVVALRVTQLGLKAANWWSIHELTVTGCKPTP